jgi:hypothetical protein
MKFTLASIALTLGLASANGPVSLTKENFDEMTAGKNAFVKFLGKFIPCRHRCALSNSFDIKIKKINSTLVRTL